MFKVGDKVRCVEPGSWGYLTKGKEYTIEGLYGDDKHVYVVCDQGYSTSFRYGRFELVEDKPFVNGYVYYTCWDGEYRVVASLSDIPSDALWVWELGDELVKKVTWSVAKPHDQSTASIMEKKDA